MERQDKNLHTLIPLETFKTLQGVDDRDDKLSSFYLLAATFSIENYCKRDLLRKKHNENIRFDDIILPLKEYPVSKIISVFANGEINNLALKGGILNPSHTIIEPDFYHTVHGCGVGEDIPFYLSFTPAIKRYRNLKTIKVMYWAGYQQGKVPADLANACMELAIWNLRRKKDNTAA